VRVAFEITRAARDAFHFSGATSMTLRPAKVERRTVERSGRNVSVPCPLRDWMDLIAAQMRRTRDEGLGLNLLTLETARAASVYSGLGFYA
jgi:hypothetical protein